MLQQVQKVGNFSEDRVKQLRADLKVLYDKVKNQKQDSDKDAMIAVRLISTVMTAHGSNKHAFYEKSRGVTKSVWF